jgi:hypothetical protein
MRREPEILGFCCSCVFSFFSSKTALGDACLCYILLHFIKFLQTCVKQYFNVIQSIKKSSDKNGALIEDRG